jgi:amidase
MLGCIGVAPGFGGMPLIAGDSAGLGGNMDYNHIVEGATVYLPVSQPGALLYNGDGHALEGDGELTGNALETSLDVEFSVEVRHRERIGAPRVEDADYISAVGLAGSLDEAIRRATVELADWLEHDYKLEPAEIAEVFGTAMQYDLVEVADRNVGIAARLRKSLLTPLRSGK